MLAAGIAREVARGVLPVTIYSSAYVTMNSRALMNFLSLRTDSNAQLDIRKYAGAVEVLFALEMPQTYKSWLDNGKACP